MPFNFGDLPHKVQSRVLYFCPYSDLARFRLTSRSFNEKCSEILNETFVKVKKDLEGEICIVFNEVQAREESERENSNTETDVENDLNRVSNIQLRYKVLQILKSEMSILHAVCLRYVQGGVYIFSGGKLLDYFYKIMNRNFNLTDAKNPLESRICMQLFLLNEEFLDHFEEVVEPEILQNNFCPWFGVKISDILDVYANSNYHIVANYENRRLQVSARHEVLKPETVTEVDFAGSSENTSKLLKISRYIRNQVKWQNFFYYVDAPYETVKNLVGKRDRRYNKFCLNPGETIEDTPVVYKNEEIPADKFKKTFSRRLGNPCSKENVCYSIELLCPENCVPARFDPYVSSFINNSNLLDYENMIAGSDKDNIPFFNDDMSLSYDLMLTIKIVLPSDNKSCAVENYVEVYHNNLACKVIESSKEIPL